ncbi:MAG: tRNA-uridine aminocarboxypropyltransferase [Planctomycetota bacterium]
MTPPRCDRCLLDADKCVCAEVERIATRTRFVIIRHTIETRRRSNSARIAALALPNCEVIEHGEEEGGRTEVSTGPGTWLLYPGGAAPDPGAPIPKRLIVLDGSWRQARRMLIRLPELHKLPRLSLPPPAPSTARLRTPPSPEGMATLEAIAHAVEFLEGAAAARPLYRLWAQFVARSIRGPRRALRHRGNSPKQGNAPTPE